MPLKINDKTYKLPGDGLQGVTLAEVVAIEDHFRGLDGWTLLGVADGSGDAAAGYTRVKAIAAWTWIAMTRAGEVLSIADVLNDYAVNEILFEEEPENPPTAA